MFGDDGTHTIQDPLDLVPRTDGRHFVDPLGGAADLVDEGGDDVDIGQLVWTRCFGRSQGDDRLANLGGIIAFNQRLEGGTGRSIPGLEGLG